jgi:UDP-2,3-diacylglucosamine pyrophosphatase LpxH
MKTHKNVLILGDLHLGDANFRLEQDLIKLLNSQKFDCIIIGGDTFDTWRGDNIENVMYKYKNIFKTLKGKKNVIFIKGNHDPNLDELEKSGFKVVNHYRYKTSNGKKVKVLHGHEFDKYREWFQIIGKITSYLEEKINRLLKFFRIPIALRFVRLWFGFDRPTIWMALRKKHYIYSDSNVLIYGHTHLPMKGHVKGIEIYNWGSWQRDRGHRPSYIINKSNKFNVEYLPVKRRKLILHFISILSTIRERYRNGIVNNNKNK